MEIVLADSLISALTGLVETETHGFSTHSIIGIAMTCLMITLMAAGYHSHNISASKATLVTRVYHKWLGISIFLLGFVQIYLGSRSLVVRASYLPTYFPYLALALAPVTCLGLWIFYLISARTHDTEEEVQLPKYSWDEFNKRIIDGHLWFVICLIS